MAFAEEAVCDICGGFFRPSAMRGKKCFLCNEKYPKVKSLDDLKKDKKNVAETLSEDRVKDIIYEILEEANLKRIKCEKCGKLFFKRGPSQKYCSECKDK